MDLSKICRIADLVRFSDYLQECLSIEGVSSKSVVFSETRTSLGETAFHFPFLINFRKMGEIQSEEGMAV